MNLQELKDMLDSARDSVSATSDYANDARSNADRAQEYSNDAYSKIDELIDNLDTFVGFDPATLREHTVLSQRLIRLQAFLARRSMEIIDGDSIDSLESENVKGLATIIDRLVEYNVDGTEVAKFDDNYIIEWRYQNGEYAIVRKEETNG